ncbi:MAG: hypothetical protein H6737_07875 [Alphaproteobacteria bacterium]|nr:hypothetical protein [Alphaproteobacteria bacterium]
MSRAIARVTAVLALAGVAGCTSPLHLTYDHGRAFTEAFTAQPDLTRPAIANSTYQLYGKEAAEIRLRVQEETTDAETNQSELRE